MRTEIVNKIIIQSDSGFYTWSFRNRKEKTLKLVVKQGSASVNGIKEADSSRLRKEEVQVMNGEEEMTIVTKPKD